MKWRALWALGGLCAGSSDAIKSGKAADFYVKELPGVDNSVVLPEMHAGLLEVGTQMGLGEGSLFFWHVRASQDTKRTIVWFNGGPGCSSMDGNLLELGPLRFDERSRLLVTAHGAWSEVSNLLFIDQPFGTGYSDPESGRFAKDLSVAAQAVVQFLGDYAEIFPEIAADDIYLAGESFAGQYIPYIWQALKDNADVRAKLGGGVAGIILGNPWMDPANQYLSYAPFLKEHGLVPSSSFEELDQLQEQCLASLSEEVTIHNKACESISQFAFQHYGGSGDCFNVYKYTEASRIPQCGLEWPPAVPLMTDWLNREDVRAALHAPLEHAYPWNECSGMVQTHLDLRGSKPGVSLLPEILEEIPVMLMIGDKDYICNGEGLDRMVKNLRWNSESAGFDSDESLETLDFGSIQSARNLTVAHVTEGSHMVPVDDLMVSQSLMKHFTKISSLSPNSTEPLPPQSGGGKGDGGKGGASQEEIDDAVLQAYKKAGFLALAIVLIIMFILACVWWRRGDGLSAKAMIQALLQTSTRFKSAAQKNQYVPLQNLGRRPEVIIEEDEEDMV